MKSYFKKFMGATALTTTIVFTTSAFSAIIPSGIQTDVTVSDFNSWGLTQCYSEAESGGPESIMSVIKQNCDYDYVGYGVYDANNSIYESFAIGEFDAVFWDNGNLFGQQLSSSYNVSNNVNFFYYANTTYGGMGFYDTNSTATPRHCDTDNNSQKDAMCMHLQAGTSGVVDTYSIMDVWATTTNGVRTGIGGSQYSIRFFGADVGANEIPVPPIFALMILGLFSLFVSKRNRV